MSRFGISLPTGIGAGAAFGASSLADAARCIEAAGFESAWTFDSLGRGTLRPDPLMALAVAGAGTHRSGQTRHGNRWLRAALTEAALAASVRSTKGACAARYRRITAHRGHKTAVVAVAHAILVTAYHLLARKTTYQDPGADYYDRRHAERVRHRAIHTLERQGYRVTLEPAA